MNEQAPKLVTQREVFRALQRNMGAYVSLGSKCPADIREGANNSAKAFNQISERIGDGGAIPTSWPDVDFPADTPFVLVKVIDGQVWQQKIACENPVIFIQKMKKFHGLENLVSEEEKQAQAAEQAERSALAAAARSGQLWRDRMPESSVPAEPETPKAPPSNSPFKFRK